MSGIFPEGGVPCEQTFNAACEIPMADGCEARFYTARCLQNVDPIQVNALISEIANVVARAGIQFDCTKLDNLADAVYQMIMSQDAITRAWMMEQLEIVVTLLTEKIDADILTLSTEVNLRMDGLLFECLKAVFPSFEGFTNVFPLGVGTQDGCTKIVRLAQDPPGPDPTDSFTYENIGMIPVPGGSNVPIMNTRGKMVHVHLQGRGGMGGPGNETAYAISMSISKNGSTWYDIGASSTMTSLENTAYLSTPLPANWFVRVDKRGGSTTLVELY